MEFLTRDQVRRLDQDAIRLLGIPGLLLMENAARGVCRAIAQSGPWQRILIVAGHGNNGGDGLAVARLLAAEGILAEVFLVSGNRVLSSDAQTNFDILIRSGMVVRQPDAAELRVALRGLSERDLIVDALLGTGIRGEVVSPYVEAIQEINQSGAAVLAVDLPSGMDCDTGAVRGVCVRADRTVTFVARKRGFGFSGADRFTGTVEVCSIGIPRLWLQSWFAEIQRECTDSSG